MIYLINFSVFICYCLNDFLFTSRKTGYYKKWRMAYSNLNALLYNNCSDKEYPVDKFGCHYYNMKSVAVKYRDLSIMRKFIIPVIERYLNKRKSEGIKEVDRETVKKDLKIPGKYVANYFESSWVIVLKGWNPSQRLYRSCYFYNFFDIFFFAAHPRLADWWINKKYAGE